MSTTMPTVTAGDRAVTLRRPSAELTHMVHIPADAPDVLAAILRGALADALHAGRAEGRAAAIAEALDVLRPVLEAGTISARTYRAVAASADE